MVLKSLLVRRSSASGNAEGNAIPQAPTWIDTTTTTNTTTTNNNNSDVNNNNDNNNNNNNNDTSQRNEEENVSIREVAQPSNTTTTTTTTTGGGSTRKTLMSYVKNGLSQTNRQKSNGTATTATTATAPTWIEPTPTNNSEVNNNTNTNTNNTNAPTTPTKSRGIFGFTTPTRTRTTTTATTGAATAPTWIDISNDTATTTTTTTTNTTTTTSATATNTNTPGNSNVVNTVTPNGNGNSATPTSNPTNNMLLDFVKDPNRTNNTIMNGEGADPTTTTPGRSPVGGGGTKSNKKTLMQRADMAAAFLQKTGSNLGFTLNMNGNSKKYDTSSMNQLEQFVLSLMSGGLLNHGGVPYTANGGLLIRGGNTTLDQNAAAVSTVQPTISCARDVWGRELFAIQSAFPDLSFSYESIQEVEHNVVMVEAVRLVGTHTGADFQTPEGPIPATALKISELSLHPERWLFTLEPIVVAPTPGGAVAVAPQQQQQEQDIGTKYLIAQVQIVPLGSRTGTWGIYQAMTTLREQARNKPLPEQKQQQQQEQQQQQQPIDGVFPPAEAAPGTGVFQRM